MVASASLTDAPSARLARPRSVTELLVEHIRQLAASGRFALGEHLTRCFERKSTRRGGHVSLAIEEPEEEAVS